MIPSDWKEDQDGYALVFFCLPNSRAWRGLITGIIESLTFGWSWNEKTGRIKDVQAIGREIFETMGICKLDDLLIEFQRLNAILAGETLNVTRNGLPLEYDYRENGIGPLLAGLKLSAIVNVEPTPITITVEPSPPLITVEPSPLAVNVEGTDLSGLITALAGLSNLDRLPDITDNLAHLQSLANEALAANEHLSALADIVTHLAAIDLDLDRINDITAAILQAGAADLTIEEAIFKLEEVPDAYGFKDYLEILNLIKQILPAGSTIGMIGSIWQSITDMRFKHNLLTILGFQATAQRGIQNAIAPFAEEGSESSTVSEIMTELDKIPWLLAATGAALEPSPAGETALAVKVAATAANWLSKAKSVWLGFFNGWANEVENPIPTRSLVDAIADSSLKMVGKNDAYSSGTGTPSIFGMLQGMALTQLRQTDTGLESTAQILARIADNLPEGVTMVDLVNSLTTQLSAIATNTASVATNTAAVATNVQAIEITIDNDALVAKLEELRSMLETRSVAETTAANTRSASEQALLNAIENVLGGSYEPVA